MTAAILYRQNQRWQIWVAFCGAVLLHLCAVALAKNQPPPPPAAIVEPEIVLEVDQQIEESSPPQIEEDPMPLPLPPVAEDVFIAEENAPTPPPIRKRNERPVQPLVRQTLARSASSSISAAKILAVVAPRPEYPYEARRQRTTGSGVALLSIDSASGSVVEVSMLQSTGSAVLDSATMSGFRRWRFRPGTVARVQTPITYTLTGASY